MSLNLQFIEIFPFIIISDIIFVLFSWFYSSMGEHARSATLKVILILVQNSTYISLSTHLNRWLIVKYSYIITEYTY